MNNPIRKQGQSEVFLDQLASLDGNVSIPTEFFEPQMEQVGAEIREVKRAYDELIPTDVLAKTEVLRDNAFIYGRSIENDLVTFGEGDDQELQSALLANTDKGHITLIAETQKGKSQRFLVPNLCEWYGSAVVIDPKGTLASVTAERRGKGNERYGIEGMKQEIHVLDPRRISTVPDQLFKRFNPLTWLAEDEDDCINRARALADALIPETGGEGKSGDDYWKDEGREFLAVILVYVAIDPDCTLPRTLNTVYELLQVGDEATYNAIKAATPDAPITPISALLDAMADSPVLDGYVAHKGKKLSQLLETAAKQWEGIRSQSEITLAWVAERAMRDCLSATDFSFKDLRNNPKGVTVYVTVKDMVRDWRWLRMITEIFLEDAKGGGKPVRGQTLFILDEFPQMKRMRTITKALADISEAGVRICIVAQSLSQLQAPDAYPNEWKQILSASRLKIFFGTDCPYTAEFAAKLIGEKEITIKEHSLNVSASFNEGASRSAADTRGKSHTDSTSASKSSSQSNSVSKSAGGSRTEGGSESAGTNHNHGRSANFSKSRGKTYPESKRTLLGAGHVPLATKRTINRNKQKGESASFSQGGSNSKTTSNSKTDTWGISESSSNSTSATHGESHSDTETNSHTETQSRSAGRAHSASFGINERKDKRHVLLPTDIIKLTQPVEPQDKDHDKKYPGQVLIIRTGGRASLVRTVVYYDDEFFYGKFGSHPTYGWAAGPIPYAERIEAQRLKRLSDASDAKRQEEEERRREAERLRLEAEAEIKNAAAILDIAIASHQRTVNNAANIKFTMQLSLERVANLSSTLSRTLEAVINPLHLRTVSKSGKLTKFIKTHSPLATLTNQIPLIRMPKSHRTLKILDRTIKGEDIVISYCTSIESPTKPDWIECIARNGKDSPAIKDQPTLQQWTEKLQTIEDEQEQAISKLINELRNDAWQPFYTISNAIDRFNNKHLKPDTPPQKQKSKPKSEPTGEDIFMFFFFGGLALCWLLCTCQFLSNLYHQASLALGWAPFLTEMKPLALSGIAGTGAISLAPFLIGGLVFLCWFFEPHPLKRPHKFRFKK